MSDLLIVNGIHTSGKTTLCRLLESEGFSYFPEIASELVSQGVTTCFQNGSLSNEEFQRKVMNAEVERDAVLSSCDGRVLVETYHLGNLAHARLLAGIQLVHEYESYIDNLRSCRVMRALYLDINPDLILERTKLFSTVDSNILDFYSELRSEIFRIYDKYKISHVVVPADGASGEVLLKVKEVLRTYDVH